MDEAQISVTLLQAKFSTVKKSFLRKAPYAVLELGKSRKSAGSSFHSGGVTLWNQAVTLGYKGEPRLYVKFFDSDLLSDNYLGEAAVLLPSAFGAHEHRGTYPISLRESVKGSVELGVRGWRQSTPAGKVLLEEKRLGSDQRRSGVHQAVGVPGQAGRATGQAGRAPDQRPAPGQPRLR